MVLSGRLTSPHHLHAIEHSVSCPRSKGQLQMSSFSNTKGVLHASIQFGSSLAFQGSSQLMLQQKLFCIKNRRHGSHVLSMRKIIINSIEFVCACKNKNKYIWITAKERRSMTKGLLFCLTVTINILIPGCVFNCGKDASNTRWLPPYEVPVIHGKLHWFSLSIVHRPAWYLTKLRYFCTISPVFTRKLRFTALKMMVFKKSGQSEDLRLLRLRRSPGFCVSKRHPLLCLRQNMFLDHICDLCSHWKLWMLIG